MKDNGCNEDGWDLFEQQTREEFEHYAIRKGYNLARDNDYCWLYDDIGTQNSWEMFHVGHVKGRIWKKCNVTNTN